MPSLVVFFFDLDWDDHQWQEKEMECASKIQVIRQGIDIVTFPGFHSCCMILCVFTIELLLRGEQRRL